MRGRALMNGGTAADVRQAIQAFEAAVASDPALAPAWAKLAEAHHLLVMMGVAAPLDAYPAAKIAAARAIGADASLSDAHVANGLVALWFDWDPRAAAAAFERALALNGSNAAAHHDYGWALVALGRDDQAIAEITTARDLDPLSARANSDIGWLYLQLRRPIDAQRACEQTLAVDATALEPQACLERAYTQRGLWDAALTAARLTSPPDAWTDDRAGRARCRRGDARAVAVAARTTRAGGADAMDQPLHPRRPAGARRQHLRRARRTRARGRRSRRHAGLPRSRSGARSAARGSAIPRRQRAAGATAPAVARSR